jgi:septal ring factor EnvC (AmiA/AmiB activator)
MLLADGANVPVKAAMMGIDAQLKLHALPTDENIDDLYSLLEQFGAVLHVDINDLLNRSENRAQTLDTYAQGLANITERSTRRLEDVKQQLADLKTQQATQRKNVSTISKDVSAAVKAKDYATAQQRQKDLADAQAELTTTESRLKEMQNVQSIFVELLGIAKERIAALDRNREILIAGLKVVDVPGVDDLGVIEGKTRGRTKGFSPFGGL